MTTFHPSFIRPTLEGPWLSSNDPFVGEVRFLEGKLKTYNGQGWHPINISSPEYLVYSQTLDDTLRWAHNKMEEEQKIVELCEKYPTLKNAKGNYDMVIQLIRAEEKLNAV